MVLNMKEQSSLVLVLHSSVREQNNLQELRSQLQELHSCLQERYTTVELHRHHNHSPPLSSCLSPSCRMFFYSSSQKELRTPLELHRNLKVLRIHRQASCPSCAPQRTLQRTLCRRDRMVLGLGLGVGLGVGLLVSGPPTGASQRQSVAPRYGLS